MQNRVFGSRRRPITMQACGAPQAAQDVFAMAKAEGGADSWRSSA
ncbi:hypothetical protein SAMN05519103_00330 [Rhizobiales bacterium GAS113]|nr:hypothetical protein SAMN05519103_00330 [Rhizobiales bacterium GAS113]